MRSAFVVIAAIGLSGGFTQAFAANLLKDGGFEEPPTPASSYTVYDTGQTFSKWTVVGNPGNVGTVSTTFTQNGYSFPAKAGQAWLDLTGNSNTATGVAQTIKTVAGTGYAVTFWVGNIVDSGGIFGTTSTVDVYDGTSLLIAAKNSNGAGGTTQVWKKFTATFTATASKTTLSFYNGDPSNDTNCGLDEVNVEPTAAAAP
jgi:Protein of unknown function (DUF642)